MTDTNLFSIILKEKTYKIFEEKLRVIKTNYRCSLLEFLGKYAEGSLISALSLYPVDDASVRSLSTTAWKKILAWFRKSFESERSYGISTRN